MAPIISVIIPTRNRPSLVIRSAQSALTQTFKDIEVLVIIDGPDEASRMELSQIDDSRLRVIELSNNMGGSGARNAGVTEADGEWIAFLDDDDEWLPQKLELQYEAAIRSDYAFPIVSCYLIARTPKCEFIWPRRLPKPSESLGDYLFVRKSFFMGEALILTSTILTKKELLQSVPFKLGLRRNQDGDWVLRASAFPGVGAEFVSEALTIWYIEENRKTTSGTTNWQHSLDWVRENRHLMSLRAYASYILVFISSEASLQGNWGVFLPLLWEAVSHGRPTPISLLTYLVNWLIPQPTRRSIRALLTKRRKYEDSSSSLSHSNGSRGSATL